MAANPNLAFSAREEIEWSLARVQTFPGLRVLAWNGDELYASRGYSLFRANLSHTASSIDWIPIAEYRPASWRTRSSKIHLAARLFRDGFHALAVLPSGHIIAAVPGAIITLNPGETEFRITHQVLRGTRPLHITATPNGRIFWGEYFDNPERDEVHIYHSDDCGHTWNVAYTFAKGEIRHVHNIIHDPWEDCLWILTGDNGSECRILKASCDFKNVEAVLSGNQQARAVALVPAKSGLYFSSDTPLEHNHIYHLDRHGHANSVAAVSSSSIFGCCVGKAIFFSTMVEPSAVNREAMVNLYGALDGASWKKQLSWTKDRWPMALFQYGNAFLPDGNNTTDILALTTIAVNPGDQETSLWRVVNK